MFLSGGRPHEPGRDDYESSPADLRYMTSTLRPEHRDCVWDPFTCSGFSARYLAHLGLRVHTEPDGGPGRDFFTYVAPPRDVTAVVTNPPFSEKRRAIEHLLALRVPAVRMIVPTHIVQRDWFTRLVRSTRDHEFSVHVPNKSLRYHRNGVSTGTAMFQSVFLCIDLVAAGSNNEQRVNFVWLDYDRTHFKTFKRLHVDGERMGEEMSSEESDDEEAAAPPPRQKRRQDE